jgi:hypothetical protein
MAGENDLQFLVSLYDQLTPNADKMTGGLAELNATLTGVDKTLQKMEGELGHTAHKVDEATGALGKMHGALEVLEGIGIFELFKAGFEVVGELIEKAVEGVIDLGKEIAHAAGEAQRQAVSFKLLLGAEGAEEALAYIDKIATHTEFTRSELKGLAQEALFKGFKKDELSNVLPAALDIGTFRGGGLGNAQAALEALARIKLTGQVQSRSLLQLGLGIDDVAKALGTTAKQLEGHRMDPNKLIGAVYDAIAAKEHGLLGTAGLAGSSLFLANLHKLKAAPEQFFEGFAETKGFAKITDFLDKLVKMLDPSSPWGQKMMKALSDTFDAIFGNLDPEELMGAVTSAAEDMLAFVKQLPGWISKVELTWHDVVKVVREVWDVLKSIGHAIEYIIDLTAGPTLRYLNDVRKQQREGMREVDEVLGRYGKHMDFRTGEILDGLADGIKAGKDKLADTLEDTATEAGKKGLKSHSPSLLFRGFGEDAAAGFAEGFARSTPMLADAINITSVAAAGGKAGGGAAIQNTTHITVNVDGGGENPDGLAQIVAERIDEVVAARLNSAFEQLAEEMGSGT